MISYEDALEKIKILEDKILELENKISRLIQYNFFLYKETDEANGLEVDYEEV
jgi:hypothetical protein